MIEVGGRDGEGAGRERSEEDEGGGQRWVEGKLENSGDTGGGIVDERGGKRER